MTLKGAQETLCYGRSRHNLYSNFTLAEERYTWEMCFVHILLW
jgi:hypothetical protein